MANLISAGNRRSWEWGAHDCLAFAAQDVEALTGQDLFEPFRGRYSDEAGAEALVPSVAAFMAQTAAEQDWPEIAASAALDGDLAIFDRGRPFVGVIYGRLVFPAAPSGFRTLPRSFVTTAWAVG